MGDLRLLMTLIDTTVCNVPRLITKNWIEINDQSETLYNINKQIRFNTSWLRSDICDYSDAYIFIKGNITVEEVNNGEKHSRNLVLKDNA